MTDTFEKRLEETVLEHADLADGSHDMSHLHRVKRMALKIAKSEGRGDRDILTAAAYLHDLVNPPKSHPDRSEASRMSAAAARPILAGMGMSEEAIANACHAIEAHSFSAGVAPRTVEAEILQDADRLDALGAIGIARVFYIAGQLGTRLFNGDDPLAERRDLDDRVFALDHFELKLFRLPETMRTRTGRMLAEDRVAYLRGFVERIRHEFLE